MFFKRFMSMVMDGFIGFMDVLMTVDMGVYQLAVAMRMVMAVGVLVGVLQANGVPNHQNCGGDHHGKAEIELQGRLFSQQQHTEQNAAEGRNGIISAGFCSNRFRNRIRS